MKEHFHWFVILFHVLPSPLTICFSHFPAAPVSSVGVYLSNVFSQRFLSMENPYLLNRNFCCFCAFFFNSKWKRTKYKFINKFGNWSNSYNYTYSIILYRNGQSRRRIRPLHNINANERDNIIRIMNTTKKNSQNQIISFVHTTYTAHTQHNVNTNQSLV